MIVTRCRTPWVLLLTAVLLGFGCGEEKNDTVSNPDPEVTPEEHEASGTLTTTTQGTIATGSGAALRVPLYAVPPTDEGGPGTMVFSIESDEKDHSSATQGKSMVSDVYLFGPDGFTFGQMLTLTVPVTGDVTGKNVELYRINQTTGNAQPHGGTYDEATHTVSTQTYHLSPWFAAVYDPSGTAWGAFHVTNTSTTHWLHLCVEGYDLKYPIVDIDFDPEGAQAAWAPIGDPGWNNSGLWYLPQGTYNLCLSMSEAGTMMQPPGEPQRWILNGMALDDPWTSSNPVTVPISYGVPPVGSVEGPCPCIPQSTTSVGTGDVQVSLTWHSDAPCDLDLYVTEPDGEVCCWINPRTSDGGQLDRDNLCETYINGRPENIFWRDAPPGPYKVQVAFYSSCGSNLSEMDFDVRVVSGTSVKTYFGTCGIGIPMVDVTTFDVAGAFASVDGSSGPGVEFGEYEGTVAESPYIGLTK